MISIERDITWFRWRVCINLGFARLLFGQHRYSGWYFWWAPPL